MWQTTINGRSVGSSSTRVMNADVGTRTAPGARTSSNSLASRTSSRSGPSGSSRSRRSASVTSIVGIGPGWLIGRSFAGSGGPRVGPSGWAARSASRRVDGREQVGEVEPATLTAGPSVAASTKQRPGALEVAGDPGRVAADVVDVGGRDLDQALEEGTLGAVVGAHPGRLEVLVRLEEVAPLVGRQARLRGPRPGPASGSGR